MTLVSIITPSYNQAAYLEQTIRSVLNQQNARIEYIIIDGASTDESVPIIKRYESRLASWISEPDRGQADAINKGLARASGEIVAWINSDDVYLPDAISNAAAVFDEHPEVVLVYGDVLAINERGTTINRLTYKQLSLQNLLCFQIIGQPAVFMRRSALQAAGGLDASFHFLLDHLLWIRLAQHGPILHVPQTWAAARFHADAKNRAHAAEFGREAFRIFEIAQNDESLAPILNPVRSRARAAAHRVDARYLLDANQPAAALSSWTKALLMHPPTALARLNILISAVLNLLGFEKIRAAVLRRRARRLNQPSS